MDSSGTNHSMTVNLYSNSNDVFAQQWANGNKTLTLTTNNDSNIVDIEQKGSGAHSATVTLQGAYSTSLNLLQQGTTRNHTPYSKTVKQQVGAVYYNTGLRIYGRQRLEQSKTRATWARL